MERCFLVITKALADESRVRILCALRSGELCVCQIVELLALSPSTVSKHLDILRQARLVENRKQGRWMYYRLCYEEVPRVVQKTFDWLFEATARDQAILGDARRLKEILKSAPEELCCGQREEKRIRIGKDMKR